MADAMTSALLIGDRLRTLRVRRFPAMLPGMTGITPSDHWARLAEAAALAFRLPAVPKERHGPRTVGGGARLAIR